MFGKKSSGYVELNYQFQPGLKKTVTSPDFYYPFQKPIAFASFRNPQIGYFNMHSLITIRYPIKSGNFDIPVKMTL
jgi:hypothetical protein